MTGVYVYLVGVPLTAALAYQVGLWLDRTHTRGAVGISLGLGVVWPFTLPLLLWATIERIRA